MDLNILSGMIFSCHFWLYFRGWFFHAIFWPSYFATAQVLLVVFGATFYCSWCLYVLLQIFSYHLAESVRRVTRVSPFRNYCNVIFEVMRNGITSYMLVHNWLLRVYVLCTKSNVLSLMLYRRFGYHQLPRVMYDMYNIKLWCCSVNMRSGGHCEYKR